MENVATWEEFVERFDEILNNDNPAEPYNDPAFLDYTKLNKSRLNRWIRTGKINELLAEKIKGINEKQTWYLILEPWCGDAAHNAPFINLMAELNPNITLKIVWRDTEPFMIDDYLTNGGKSIPKLVVRDANEEDLYIWGPRPATCQKLFLELKESNADEEELKIELQKWYNGDKGASIQEEFMALIK